MNPRVEDTQRIVVGSRKEDQLMIRQRGCLKPEEHAVLCHRWGAEKAHQGVKGFPHLRSRLDMAPPSFSVAVPPIAESSGQDRLLDDVERICIESSLVLCAVEPEVNDEQVAASLRQISPIH